MQTIKKAYTPLMLASKNQHLLVVKYLLEHGANPHLKDAGSISLRQKGRLHKITPMTQATLRS